MWRLDTLLLASALFVAFIPGVVTTLPSKSSGKWTILAVHALLFGIVTHAVMKYYHKYVIFREGFGNHGPSCPASHYMDEKDQTCNPKVTNPHLNPEVHGRG
jgi:hypothetical protein